MKSIILISVCVNISLGITDFVV
uniref:Uncharacterized protein n=1 Tax=Rhizophora mucronata TaxID=61149 RepID=A0A2P2IWI2_RHIMU